MDCFGCIFTEVSSLIKEENYNEVELILEKYQLVGSPEFPLLHFSAAYCDRKLTQYLLDRNYYDINAQDSNGITPLMAAVKNRHEIIIQMLLRAGADITLLNYKKESALHMFCADHWFSVTIRQIFFNELRKKFATSEETAQSLIHAGCHLYQAVYLGDIEIIEYMLKHGFSANSIHPFTKDTSLHLAISVGIVEIVKLLLKYSNDVSSIKCEDEKVTQYLLDSNDYVNAQNFNGITPLMIAVRNRQERMIQILLDTGADITMLNHENKSALHMFCAGHGYSHKTRIIFFLELDYKFATSEERAQCLIDAGCHLYQAAYLNDFKIIKYMLERGFSVDSADPITKQSALHLSVMLENIEGVKLLLKYGANIHAVDSQGFSPMSYIYEYDQKHTSAKIELLKIFLNQEILPTSCSSSGFFHISATLMFGSNEAIRTVLQSNIDFTAKDEENGRSVFYYFAINKNPGVFQELKPYLDKCDINYVDKSGLSPLHTAVKHSNVDMVEFLLSRGTEVNCAHTRYGRTPLYYAYVHFKPLLKKQWEQCLELLLQHKADPQFIAADKTSHEQITIFDVAEKEESLHKLKPVIAHLAVLEGQGVPITTTTLTKMNSYPSLKKYFNKCQKLIRKEICGSVTLLKLLTGNEKRIVQYSGNKKLMLKLNRLICKQNLKSSYLYYHGTLKKRISKGIKSRRFLDNVAGVICKIFGSRCDKTNLVINKIVDYLNEESLCQLFKLSNGPARRVGSRRTTR